MSCEIRSSQHVMDSIQLFSFVNVPSLCGNTVHYYVNGVLYALLKPPFL
jgi:hypothetical protein